MDCAPRMCKRAVLMIAVVLTLLIICVTEVQATTVEVALVTETDQKTYDGKNVYGDKVGFTIAVNDMEIISDILNIEVILKNHQGDIVDTYTEESDIWIFTDENVLTAELAGLADGHYSLYVKVAAEEDILTETTVNFIKDSTKPKVTVENKLTYNEERSADNFYTGGTRVITVEEMTLTTDVEKIISGIENTAENWSTAIDEKTGLVTKTITLNFGKNESYEEGNYNFHVTAKDALEREITYATEKFYIDYTPPVLENITYDTESLFQTVGTRDYVNTPTKIAFTITEHNPSINKSFITSDNEERDSEWTEIDKDVYTTEVNVPMLGEKGDEQTITLTILDKAGNAAVLGADALLRSENNTAFEAGVFIDRFTVDTVAPVIKLEYEEINPNRFNIEEIDYFNQSVTVKVTIDEHNFDENSFAQSVKSTDDNITYEESEWTITDDTRVKTFTFNKDNQYNLSFVGLDYAKNELKIQTVDKVSASSKADGTVTLKVAVDQINPSIELTAKTAADNTTIAGQALYNKDVIYEAMVEDSLLNNYASGIYNIRFSAKGEDGTTATCIINKDGTVVNDAGLNVTKAGGGKKQTFHVAVSSQIFNTDGIVLTATVEDVSTNKNEVTAKAISIDTTAPTAEIIYDNNDVSNEKYFHAERTATITVTERNFSDECFQFFVNGEDKELEFKLLNKGSGNRDDAVWTASYTFDSDGDYEVECVVKDRAANHGTVSYGGEAPQDFTIDMTNPEVKIEFDNHNVFNESYYDAQRIATIIVIEHNFDSGDVIVMGEATDAGVEVAFPILGGWSSNGDEHRATLTFAQDALYTLDVEYTDLAANEANDIPEEHFTVDTKDPELTITGVENEMPYPEEIRPRIDFSDNNYDRYEAVLTRTERERIGVDITEKYIGTIGVAIDATGKGVGGKLCKDVEHLEENDGIYTLEVNVYDKAGRSTKETVTYSVNRFGSVYVYSDDLTEILKGYHKSVNGNLYVAAYNADQLLEASTKLEITCDGAALANQKSRADVKTALQPDNGGWYEYKFRLNSKDFENDGHYTITISDKDEAGNTRTNSDHPIEFYIDTTAPVLDSVIGLEKAIVNADEQIVQYVISDAIALKYVKIYVNDKLISNIKEFDSLTAHNGIFSINAGMRQKIRIVAEDKAGNILDTAAEAFASGYAFHDEITVSTNFWIRWYANTSLFWGSICGIVIVTVGGIIFLITKKRKRNVSS